MNLPEHVKVCLDRLENAGYAAYVVGGCVRDARLGIAPHDYDMCTAALPEQTEAVFSDLPQTLTGKKHGTVAVVFPEGTVEITTFRREGGYTDNRHPDWVEFVTDVESDLARRDFTVNAMAWSPYRGYADPFGGRQDLADGILRTVGDPRVRFREDSLRILRGLRFAARFSLKLHPETEKAMTELAPLTGNLAAERIYEELCGLLPLLTRETMLRFAPVLSAVIPELKPMVGFDQRSPHHAYDLYTHVSCVVEKMPADLTLRWAALLHDIGKIPTATVDETGRGHYYGHAAAGAEMADAVLRRLKAPAALREQTVKLIGGHMFRLKPDRKLLRRALADWGWENVEQLLLLQEADMLSKGTGEHSGDNFTKIRELLGSLRQEDPCLHVRDLAVNGRDMRALGLSGRAVGEALKGLLELVLEEELDNTRQALLEKARQLWAVQNGACL